MMQLRGKLGSVLGQLPDRLESPKEEALAQIALLQWEAARLSIDHDVIPEVALASFSLALVTLLEEDAEDEHLNAPVAAA